ncbi:UDP-N-acetylglucosamine 2-epimerase [Thermodesulfobacteriota bacterium]
MIYIVYGTKAQLIKMFPIIKELHKRDFPYHLIDTGQHAILTKEFRKKFGIREPDIHLGGRTKNITSVASALVWNLRIAKDILINRRKMFSHSNGICLIHGDTISTLQGLIMGKLANMKIGHIEAGERTHHLLKPFPEELIRIIVDRFSDYAFSSSEISQQNLLNEKFRGEIIDLGQNTILDAVRIAVSQDGVDINVPSTYILVSIHRFETIQSKERLKIIVDALENISENYEVVWGLHEPTRKQLNRFGLLRTLEENPKIYLRELWDYFSFIKAIKNATFLITDGGGPQEESWFLNVPCMLMRSETEREYHPNVYLTKFDRDRISYFAANFHQFRAGNQEEFSSPSRQIVDFLGKHPTWCSA